AGENLGGNEKPFVIRYKPGGALDKTLAGDGSLQFTVNGASNVGSVTTVLSLPDNDILVSAQSSILRFNSDGTPETTFGTNGSTTVAPPTPDELPIVEDFVIDPDGNIDAVADTFTSGVTVARLTSDGKPDQNFAPNGRVIVTDIARANTLTLADNG